jgi:hypothetical protein
VPTIWIISDAKPGHLNQSLGLAETLQRHRPQFNIIQLPALTAVRAIAAGLSGRYPGESSATPFDLIIATGHRTHLTLLAARRCFNARAIVLMTPSLPYRCFDLCLIPEHDQPPESDNILPTQGPLNRISPDSKPDPNQGLMLIGGPSKHFDWSNEAIVKQVDTLVTRESRINWTLATSRRTPADFLQRLPAGRPNLNIIPVEQTHPDWLPVQLSCSGVTWVTEDSASMVYEALTSGGAVGIFQGIPKTANRISSGITQLAAKGLITRFERWQQSGALEAPSAAFNEAERCAQWIIKRWKG